MLTYIYLLMLTILLDVDRSVFGTGTGNEYHESPIEQYFTTDYDPLAWDSGSWAIDVTTDIPPHMITDITLCNAQKEV